MGNPLLEHVAFQYYFDPKMEADFQFNAYKVLYLSLAYHIENPLYLPMKLSFFKKESMLKGRFSFYLLLNHDVVESKEMDFFAGVDGDDDEH